MSRNLLCNISCLKLKPFQLSIISHRYVLGTFWFSKGARICILGKWVKSTIDSHTPSTAMTALSGCCFVMLFDWENPCNRNNSQSTNSTSQVKLLNYKKKWYRINAIKTAIHSLFNFFNNLSVYKSLFWINFHQGRLGPKHWPNY